MSDLNERKVTDREGDFHSWLIVAASSLLFFLNGSIFFTQGLLFPEFLKEFGASEVATSWIIGVLNGMVQIGALVTCWLSTFLEYRGMAIFGNVVVSCGFIISYFVTNMTAFYFTYSVIIGFGMGFQYVPGLLMPQICFERRRALAIAIAISGCPLGYFLFSPIFQFLINTYGWRGAILIHAAIVLNGCAAGLVLIPPKTVPPPPLSLERKKFQNDMGSIASHGSDLTIHSTMERKKLRNDAMGSTVLHSSVQTLHSNTDINPYEKFLKRKLQNDMGSIVFYSRERLNDPTLYSSDMKPYQTFLKKMQTLFDVSIFKSGTIFAVFAIWLLHLMGLPVLSNFLPLAASNYGISKETASFMLSVCGLSDFMGRMTFGIVGNFCNVPSVYLWCFTTFAAGFSHICLTWTRAVPVLYLLVAIYGISIGGWFTCSSVALVDLFGIEQVAKSYGIMQIAHSIGFFTSSALHASFATLTGGPQMAFLLGGILQVSGGLSLLLHYICCGRTKRKKTQETENQIFENKDTKQNANV